MTTEEILDFNKRCVEFLNLHIDEEVVIYNMHSYVYDLLKFHSDWNWIMEVIDAIEKLEFNFDSYNPSGIGKNGFYEFNIWNRINLEIQGRGHTIKEAYINAINQFLIWYKQNN